MTPSLAILFLLTWPPPIPDGPSKLISIERREVDFTRGCAFPPKFTEVPPTYQQSVLQGMSSIDGSKGYLLRFQGGRFLLSSVSRDGPKLEAVECPLKQLVQMSFDGRFLIGIPAKAGKGLLIISSQSHESVNVPRGRLFSTNSGTFVVPMGHGRTGFQVVQSPALTFKPVAKSEILRKLTADYGVSDLSWKFLDVQAGCIGAYGKLISWRLDAKKRMVVTFRSGKAVLRIGEAPESGPLVMIPNRTEIVLTRFGDKLECLSTATGALTRQTIWIDGDGKVGRSWILMR